MTPIRYSLDATRSRVSARTGTEGLLSPLAHDLVIVASSLRGEATETDAGWEATISVPGRALEVAGVVRRGFLDTKVLSEKDRSEIDRRIREEVLQRMREVEVKASGTDQTGTANILFPNRSVHAQIRFDRFSREESAIVIDGKFTVSLRALGLAPIKGPMGMFRVADSVDVHVVTTFVKV